MSESQSDIQKRMDSLTDALLSGPDEATATKLYIERAHWFNVLGEDVKSIEDYLMALELTEDTGELVHIKSMIALALLQKGNKESAFWWAFAAVEQDRSNAEGHYTFGLNCQWCEFYLPAIESFTRVLQLQPDHRAAMLALGTCLRDEYRLDESVEVLSKYVTDFPDDPKGLFELAWTFHMHVSTHDWKAKALEFYEKALEHNPSVELKARIERKLKSMEEYEKR